MPRELDGVTGGSQRRSSRASSTSKTHVLDRFHAVRWFAWGLIEVRRARPTHRRQRGASRVRAVDLPFPLLTADPARSPESPAIRASHRSHLTGPELWHAWQLTQPLVRTRQTTRLQPGPCSRNSLRDTRSCPFRNSRLSSSCWRSGCPRSWRSTHAIASPTAGLRGQQQAGVLKRIAYGFKIPRNFEARALLICPAVA